MTEATAHAVAPGLGSPTASDERRTPEVVVLLSTYNGERYVAEQLRSILEQLPPGGRILVRDDGSSDKTVACVQALGDARIELACGPNLGFGSSFLTLLTLVPADADLVMFADQDDVWLPGKIERAWRHLQPLGDVPALYGSAQMLVDEQLRPMHPTRPWAVRPSFARALMENFITGCTAAINRPALQLLQRAGVPTGVRFHDWWAYLVVSAFGTVVLDPEPTLLYRQHGANQIGHGTGLIGRRVQMVRFLLRNDWVGILLSQVDALLRHFAGDLPSEARRLVDAFFKSGSAVVPRWRLVFSLCSWRQSRVDEIALRLMFAAYRLHLWPPPARRLVMAPSDSLEA